MARYHRLHGAYALGMRERKYMKLEGYLLDSEATDEHRHEVRGTPGVF